MTTVAAKIAQQLAGCIEKLAEDLVGSPPTFRSRDEISFYPKGGLSVIVRGQRRGIWCNHGAGGVGGDPLDLVHHMRGGSIAEAIAWARAWLGLASWVAGRQVASDPQKLDAAPSATLPMAREIWREAVEAVGSPVEVYLRSRAGYVPPCGVIRYHPACPRGAERLPAMVALMTDPLTGEPCGLHRTFLRPDGSGKAVGQAKLMAGNAGVIRLVADDVVSDGLGLTEGIETALSLMHCAMWSPIWAAGSAGTMRKFPVLPGIEALTLFPDMDDSGAGAAAARVCATLWSGAGRSVQTFEPRVGQDWNDALRSAA